MHNPIISNPPATAGDDAAGGRQHPSPCATAGRASAKRKHISLRTKLAAALCHMLRPDDNGQLVLVIPYEQAKRMTEDEVLAVFDFDHWPVPKAMGGEDAHYNLTPRPRSEHREKTAKMDIPAIAKGRRITKAQEDFRKLALERPCGQKRSPRGTLKSAGFRKAEKQRSATRPLTKRVGYFEDAHD